MTPSLFIASTPLAAALMLTAVLLWLQGRRFTNVGAFTIKSAALVAGMTGTAAWMQVLGTGPGLVASLWSLGLLAPLVVISVKQNAAWQQTWLWACVLAGGLHVNLI